MSDEFQEASADTVEEATRLALERAGLAAEDAEIEVLSHGAPVVPGERISSAQARVRVRRVSGEAQAAREKLSQLLELMGVDATVEVRAPAAMAPDDGPAPAILEVQGTDLGILIGWRGESLRALQTVLNLMLGAEPGRSRVVVDVAGYRERRERAVAQTARRIADSVVRSGRAQSLSPMAPYERRAVHLALADDPRVETESAGVDDDRHVVVRPAGRSGRVGGAAGGRWG